MLFHPTGDRNLRKKRRCWVEGGSAGAKGWDDSPSRALQAARSQPVGMLLADVGEFLEDDQSARANTPDRPTTSRCDRDPAINIARNKKKPTRRPRTLAHSVAGRTGEPEFWKMGDDHCTEPKGGNKGAKQEQRANPLAVVIRPPQSRFSGVLGNRTSPRAVALATNSRDHQKTKNIPESTQPGAQTWQNPFSASVSTAQHTAQQQQCCFRGGCMLKRAHLFGRRTGRII